MTLSSIRALRQGTVVTAATFALALAVSQANAAEVLSSGTFEGASNHVTSGNVEVITENGQTFVVLKSNFNFDGAPDPKVGFGKDGAYDGASQIEHLRADSGMQSYEVPAGLDISGYNEVYIWCEKYSVPLGVAKLN